MSDETSTHQGQGEIIIVKKVQGGGGGHHGGAWKIAYADFVTAMMAFFLVMWLVNAANENTKASVASYFNPIKLTDSSPSSKDVKKSAESQKGQQSQEASQSESDQKTKGEAADEGKQEKSMAGEETDNSEADYFENPYAVLAEIVLETSQESNISEAGDGGAQNSGSATGASGGEAYRDPFDPDFWSKQISNDLSDSSEVLDPTVSTEDKEAAETQNESINSAGEIGQNDEKIEDDDIAGEFGLSLGAGDVYDKTAGAGDILGAGAAISDHDVGGDKTGLAPFEGDMGGKEFDDEGRHISELDPIENQSSTLPAGDTPIDELETNRFATLYEKGQLDLTELRMRGDEERLTSEEAEELLALVRKEKTEDLSYEENERKEELLAKNDAARQIAQQIADLQDELAEYEELMAQQDVAGEQVADDEQLADAQNEQDLDGEQQFAGVTDQEAEDARNLEKEIREALEGVSGKLAEGLIVTPAEGGILLSLTDQLNVGMFNVGSAIPKRDTIILMEKIGAVLNQRQGAIAIRGHTDSRPYSSGGNDNWRLSMSRAHSAYFMLVRGGIPEDRITQVTGFADRRLKVPDDPFSELNRRIEILVQPEET